MQISQCVKGTKHDWSMTEARPEHDRNQPTKRRANASEEDLTQNCCRAAWRSSGPAPSQRIRPKSCSFHSLDSWETHWPLICMHMQISSKPVGNQNLSAAVQSFVTQTRISSRSTAGSSEAAGQTLLVPESPQRTLFKPIVFDSFWVIVNLVKWMRLYQNKSK